MNWTKKHTLILIFVLIAGFALRLLPLLPPDINLLRHVPDDAFYLYCEADNLAHGKGLSFDGVNPTTTSRPLYIVMLAGVDWLAGRTLLPQLAYFLGVLAELMTFLLIIRFLRKAGVAPLAAILGLLFYVTSARIIFYGVNGMETPYAILSIAVLLNLYQMDHKTGFAGIMHALGRGLVIALMMLLRLDYVFLAVSATLYEIWLGIRHRRWDWFWVGSAVALIMAPWVWWSMATNGSLMPPSGDALTIIFAPTFAGGFNEILERINFFLNACNLSLYLVFFLFKFVITASIALWLLAALLVLYRIETKTRIGWLERCAIALLALIGLLTIFIEVIKWFDYAVVALVVLYLVIKLAKRQEVFKKTLIAVTPLALGFACLVFYYTAIRLYIRLWNTIEGGLFISIILGALCAFILKRRFGIIYLTLLICWVLAANIVIALATFDKGAYPSQERFERTVVWVRQNLPPDAIVAAANGGIIQWYGGRTLVDVAGIEDAEAYKALKAHKIYDYLKKRNVEYLIDPDVWIFKFYKDYWGVDMSGKLEEVYNSDPEDKDKYAIPRIEIVKPIVYKLK